MEYKQPDIRDVEYGQPSEADYAVDKRSVSQWLRSLKPNREPPRGFEKCPLDGKKCPTVIGRKNCPIAKSFGVSCPLEG